MLQSYVNFQSIDIFEKWLLSKLSASLSLVLENKYALWTDIYPAMTAFTDQYSLPNIFFDIGQL
jgi:hypothetical protein